MRFMVVLAAVLALSCAARVSADATPADATPAVAAPGPASPCPTAPTGTVSTGIFLATSAHIIGAVDVPVCVTGTIAVDYRGSAAAGCHREGVCAVRGDERWDPRGPTGPDTTALSPGEGDLSVLAVRAAGRRELDASLALDSDRLVAGTGPQCSSTGGQGPAANELAISHGTVELSLTGDDWIGTRCAGPLEQDLRSALPTAQLPLTTLLAGSRTVSLAGTRTFSAGGFSGTVVSTISLALGTPQGSLTKAPPHGRSGKPVPTEAASVQLLSAHGRLAVHAVARAPGCRTLGACGQTLSGSLTTRDLHAVSAYLERIHPPGEHPAVIGVLTWRDQGHLSMREGNCRDAEPLTQTALAIGEDPTDYSRLELYLDISTGAYDPLRTRCAGPMLGKHYPLTGSIPLSDVLGHTATLRLNTPAAYPDHGWQVRITGTVAVEVRAGRLHPDKTTTT